ncbi:alpha/beta-hydrolase [Stipitochalara longipes BDJ]|nr:alpha/beta-hydrolase [Stipitochalara longipes BDJ]
MTVPYTKDWASLARLNPELETLLIPLKGFQLIIPGVTTLETARAGFAKRQQTAPWPGVHEKDIQIPMRDGTTIRACVYSPSEPGTTKKPLAIFAFGGGFVLGSLETEEANCRTWAKRYGGVAVSIGYRVAPEHKWPGTVEDVYDAVKWVAEHHRELESDPSKGFILGGTSSGATIMATISHLWRDDGLAPPLTGLFLAVPAPCVVSALPEKYRHQELSWEQNRDAPVFNSTTSEWNSNIAQFKDDDPLRSPLLFPTGHKDLPPTYFAVAGADPWRDAGLIYEEILREECGVKTKADIYGGLVHGFWSIFPNAEFSKEYRLKADEALQWLLEQSK